MNPKARNLTWALVALLVAGIVVLQLVATLIGTDNTTTIRQAQHDNAETLRLIRSCTTPGKECFDRGQKQTAGAVADINRVAIFAAACADRPAQQTVEQIQSCVIARLAQVKHP